MAAAPETLHSGAGAEYAEARGAGDSALPEWVVALRERGARNFGQHGVPTPRIEAWKYTALRGLQDRLVEPSKAPAVPDSPPPAEPLDIEDARRLVLTDGAFAGTDGDGRVDGQIDGVTVLPLDQALREGRLDGLADWIGSLPVEHPGEALSALNDAHLGEQGLFIAVDDGVDAGRLLLDWRPGPDAAGPARHVRVVVALGEGARLSLIEHFGGGPGHSESGHVDAQAANPAMGPVLNLVCQCRLAAGAALRHARLQSLADDAWLISRGQIEQAGDSRYDYTGLDLGGALVRHDLLSRLSGAGARSDMNGAYLPAGRSHVDYHLAVEHRAPDCASGQFFRGVIGDEARAVFNGRVHVLPGADGTEAQQSNHNLLLSDRAEVDTKPELEIEADEVVASHGATVGRLDEDAIFYLRSRGLDNAQARELLVSAFCQAALDRIPDTAVRAAFTAELAKRTGADA